MLFQKKNLKSQTEFCYKITIMFWIGEVGHIQPSDFEELLQLHKKCPENTNKA